MDACNSIFSSVSLLQIPKCKLMKVVFSILALVMIMASCTPVRQPSKTRTSKVETIETNKLQGDDV